MSVLLILVFGVLGLLLHSGGDGWLAMLFLGGAFGYLLAAHIGRGREIERLSARLDEHREKLLELMQRLGRLERAPPAKAEAARPETSPPDAATIAETLPRSDEPIAADASLLAALRAAEDAVTAPRTAETMSPQPRAAETERSPPRTPASQDHPAGRDGEGSPLARLARWFMQGNPLAKLGILLLFFGLSYLFKFAADRDLFPVELRLGGAALLAAGLLALGWRLRAAQPVFALLLQGAAAGSLYLTIFAAFRLFDLLPQALAFALMLVVCASSVTLAVLQRAQPLAVMASLGGFLAPLLLSSGHGSHVGLFSYYLLLSGGILAVSLFQSWRALNLIGFFFTFGVASLWGAGRYRPELYAECQFFLIAFLLIYGVVALLFALRQTEGPKGFVDGTLVFGAPLLGFGLQYGLTRHWPLGPAFSALGFAAFYLPLAYLLLRRRPEAGRLLAQAFFAVGLAFLTLAIPLGLDARWTALAWALEGAGLIWVGRAQGRRRLLWSGAVLELAAAASMLGFMQRAPGLAAGATCGLVLAGAWLAAAFVTRSRDAPAEPWPERETLHYALFSGGLVWWSLTLFWIAFEAGRGPLAPEHRMPLFLALASASALAWQGLDRRLRWRDLGRAAWLLWAAWIIAWTLDTLGHPLRGWSWPAWAATLGTGLWLLRRREADETPAVRTALHAGLFWTGAALLVVESLWRIRAAFLFPEEWLALGYLALPALLTGVALYARRGARWPFAAEARAYVVLGPLPLALLMLGGLVFANLADGWTRELGVYLPLLNPLEFSAAAALLALALWRRQAGDLLGRLPPARSRRLFAALAFWWGNGVLLRLLAEGGSIPWTAAALWDSRLVQTSLALAWTATALATMWLATRRAQRGPWIVGAALLGAVVLKLFLVDSAASGGLARAVAFIGVALLLLLIGYVAPLPPRADGPRDRVEAP